MSIRALFPYFYFFIWVVLALFQYVYNSNFIYEPLLLFLTGSALYYTFYAATNYKLPVYFKCLILFVFVLCIYGFFLVLIGDDIYWRTTGHLVRKYLYILWLIPALLSVFPVYVYTCRGILDEHKMKILFVIFFVCCICSFYGGLEQQRAYAVFMDLGQEEYTVTSVYSFLSILPLIILFKRKIVLQFLFLAIVFVYLILSAKRGAVLLGAGATMILIWGLFVQNNAQKKITVAFVTLVLLIGVYLFVNYQMETSQYLANRVDQTMEGQTSRRDEYIKIIYDYYVNSTNLRQFFFGIGAQGTLSVNESFAHNDWLAILLEQGVMGAFIYFIYWVCFVYTWVKSKNNLDAFVVLGMLIVVGFGKSIFSMYYLPISAEMMASSGYFTIALGYYLGKIYPQNDPRFVKKIVNLKIVNL